MFPKKLNNPTYKVSGIHNLIRSHSVPNLILYPLLFAHLTKASSRKTRANNRQEPFRNKFSILTRSRSLVPLKIQKLIRLPSEGHRFIRQIEFGPFRSRGRKNAQRHSSYEPFSLLGRHGRPTMESIQSSLAPQKSSSPWPSSLDGLCCVRTKGRDKSHWGR